MTRQVIALALSAFALSTLRAYADTDYHGMSYTSFGQNSLASTGSDLSLLNMSVVGVDTVAINVWWFQDSVSSNSMGEDFTRYSSTISSVEHAIDTIHNLGMKVLLKPMLDVKDGNWRAYINPSDPNQWFGNYTNFLGTFADIAQAKNVELFSIGCEMNNLEKTANNTRWSNVVTNMRSRYSGKLTYAANWSAAGDPDGGGPLVDAAGGYESVPWWNQLDYIGIDAYFPLSNSGQNNTTLPQLQAKWQSLANSIETWRAGRGLTQKVLFTEVGYPSFDGGTQTPWGGSGPVDLQEQADAYTALLSTMAARPWFDGAFWWSWETNPYAGGPTNSDFTPQSKPAEAILASYYGGTPTTIRGVPTQSLFSWENGLEGWQISGFNAQPVTITQSTQGTTAGTHSLAITETVPNRAANHFSWNARVALADDAKAALVGALQNGASNYRVEFDVTYDAAAIADPVSWIQLSIAFNNANGWSQVDGIATTGGNAGEVLHISIPLSSWASLLPTSPWYELIVGMNGDWGGGGATVFLDNLRLVNSLTSLTGDFNGDGYVDAADYTVWRDTFGGATDWRADHNLNGVVDIEDYRLWKREFGASLPGAAAGGPNVPVPEPSSSVLAIVVAAIVFAKSRWCNRSVSGIIRSSALTCILSTLTGRRQSYVRAS